MVVTFWRLTLSFDFLSVTAAARDCSFSLVLLHYLYKMLFVYESIFMIGDGQCWRYTRRQHSYWQRLAHLTDEFAEKSNEANKLSAAAVDGWHMFGRQVCWGNNQTNNNMFLCVFHLSFTWLCLKEDVECCLVLKPQ